MTLLGRRVFRGEERHRKRKRRRHQRAEKGDGDGLRERLGKRNEAALGRWREHEHGEVAEAVHSA